MLASPEQLLDRFKPFPDRVLTVTYPV